MSSQASDNQAMEYQSANAAITDPLNSGQTTPSKTSAERLSTRPQAIMNARTRNRNIAPPATSVADVLAWSPTVPLQTSNCLPSATSLQVFSSTTCAAPPQASSSNTQAPLTLFTLFRNLPSEVKLLIWQTVVQPPQTIILQAHQRRSVYAQNNNPVIRLEIISIWPPPVISHVCADSRAAVALNINKKWSTAKNEARQNVRNTLFINPHIDTMIIKISSRYPMVNDTSLLRLHPPLTIPVSQRSASFNSNAAIYSVAYRSAEDGGTETYLVIKSPESWQEMNFASVYNSYKSIAVEELTNRGLRPYCYRSDRNMLGTWGGIWKQLTRDSWR